MCSSRPNPTEPQLQVDVADWLGTLSGVGAVCALLVAGSVWLDGRPLAPPPGEVVLSREIRLHMAPVAMPEMTPSVQNNCLQTIAPLPEPIEKVFPKQASIPEPEPEILPLPPRVEREPEPAAIAPPVDAAPVQASQTPEKVEGEAGREEAIRTEWLIALRQRIEQSKFYPGAARYSRETGTVLLQVEISSLAEIGSVRILDNTGSPLLAEGARAILRRAATKPLGTNALSEAFLVEVPITYRVGRR